MRPLNHAASRWRPTGLASSFVAAFLLLFAVLGAACGASALFLAKSVASPYAPGSQMLRVGGPQQRLRAALDTVRAAVVAEQQLTRATSWKSLDDAAAAGDIAPTAAPAHTPAGPSRVDSQRHRAFAAAYLSRAPPAAA